MASLNLTIKITDDNEDEEKIGVERFQETHSSTHPLAGARFISKP